MTMDWQAASANRAAAQEDYSEQLELLKKTYPVDENHPLRVPTLEQVGDDLLHQDLVEHFRQTLSGLLNAQLESLNRVTSQELSQLRRQRGGADWFEVDAGMALLRAEATLRGYRKGLPGGRRCDPERTAALVLTDSLRDIYFAHRQVATRIVHELQGKDAEAVIKDLHTDPKKFGNLRPGALRQRLPRLSEAVRDYVRQTAGPLGTTPGKSVSLGDAPAAGM